MYFNLQRYEKYLEVENWELNFLVCCIVFYFCVGLVVGYVGVFSGG